MKKLATYTLIILISLASSHETIHYFSKLIGVSTIAWVHDLNCEGNDSESKSTDEKDGKKDSKEYLFSHKLPAYVINTQLSIVQHARSFYASSDYSIDIYSPPRACQ